MGYQLIGLLGFRFSEAIGVEEDKRRLTSSFGAVNPELSALVASLTHSVNSSCKGKTIFSYLSFDFVGQPIFLDFTTGLAYLWLYGVLSLIFY